MNKRDYLSITLWVIFILGCIGLRQYYLHSDQVDGTSWLSRKMLDFNYSIFGRTEKDTNPIKTFPKSAVKTPARANGFYGMRNKIDTIGYKIKVTFDDNKDTITLNIQEVLALPKISYAFDFKCVEGWNQYTHWTGTPFKQFMTFVESKMKTKSDLAKQYKYVGLTSVNGGYYVGIDMPAMLHSQTILASLLNDQILPQNQGYPIRLIIPIKYGIKHIKQIGSIRFSHTPPNDYWAERGYDYDSGL